MLGLVVGCGGESTTNDATDTIEEVAPDGIGDVDTVDVTDATTEPGDVDVDTVDATDTTPDADLDVSDAGDTTEVTSSGFPSHGLVVRILEPGSAGVAEASGASAMISGILFGDAVVMSWQAGAQSGSIVPETFWRGGPVNLVPGDNRIVVTANDGTRAVTDVVVVTYNPAFRFDDLLIARPRLHWVGGESDLVVSIPLTRFSNADTNTLRLVEVDAQGTLIGEIGAMRDDGRVSSSGDEIEQDGIFTWSGRFACTSVGSRYFRATVKVGTQPSYTAVSSSVRVECLERVTTSSCNAHRSLVESAGAALTGGASVAEVQAQLAAEADVAAVGPSEDGSGALWVAFKDGLLGAVLPPVDLVGGTRGGPGAGAARLAMAAMTTAPPLGIGSKRALVLSPRRAELGVTDEGDRVAASLAAVECPRFEVEGGRAWVDGEAGLARWRSASNYGVVSIATHGEVLFGGLDAAWVTEHTRWVGAGPQEVLLTGDEVACGSLLQAEQACVVTSETPSGGCPVGTRCLVTRGLASDAVATGEGVCLDETQADLRLGHALITNRGYAVTPSFFGAWRGRGYPTSLVHLGACRSLWNGTLAAALYAAGARAVSGFTGAVDSAWAGERAAELFASLTSGATAGPIASALVGAYDPQHPTTRWTFFGAANLDLSGSELLNPDFEGTALTGWNAVGDGRVVAKFGNVEPVSGKGMGVVSTGLGFSVETGRLEQTFCVPTGKSELSLYWKFMSEEFKEWCGNTKFQDRFRAELVDAGGAVRRMVDVRVDDLCGYSDGVCAACAAPKACDAACSAEPGCYLVPDEGVCRGDFNCQCGREYTGLTSSSLGFDQGGVYETVWRRSILDVSDVAGRGPVTLRLVVEDSGDSLFDSAVLVDDLRVE